MNILEDIVLIVVGLFIAAILLPPALTSLATASTTGWNPAVVTIVEVLLPILAVIGIALYFMPKLRE